MAKRVELEKLGGRLFPHHINTYNQCPRRFFWTFVHKQRMPAEFSGPRTIGALAHRVIAKVLCARRDGLPEPSIDDLVREYVATERYLPEDGDELRAQHIPIIIGHVQRGLDCLPPDAEILHVEETFQFPMPNRRLDIEVFLAAKVDLVLRVPQGAVDHVDFKSGKGGGDSIQNYVSRLTVGKSLSLETENLRTVNALTASGEYRICESRRESLRDVWVIIQEQIDALIIDTEWIPRPEMPSCGWCKFLSICKQGKELAEAGYQG